MPLMLDVPNKPFVLSVVMLNVIMLNVVTPDIQPWCNKTFGAFIYTV
jgi:hypothetical protein